MRDRSKAPRIDDYSFGSITIEGQTYSADVIIHPRGIEDWWRREGHLLQTVDIAPILSRNPNVLVVGTGYNGFMRIHPDVERFCGERGIELIARRTTDAWKLYNDLIGEGEKTVLAALHLTC